MSAQNHQQPSRQILNNKVFHDYFVEDKFEAGVILTGTEVKSIRAGHAQIADAFVKFERGKAVLFNSYIDEYAFGNKQNHESRRTRVLLLHKRECERLRMAVEKEGLAVIPTRMYFKGALVKVEIALCKGKKLHDKRESIKEKTALREAERAVKKRAF